MNGGWFRGPGDGGGNRPFAAVELYVHGGALARGIVESGRR